MLVKGQMEIDGYALMRNESTVLSLDEFKVHIANLLIARQKTNPLPVSFMEVAVIRAIIKRFATTFDVEYRKLYGIDSEVEAGSLIVLPKGIIPVKGTKLVRLDRNDAGKCYSPYEQHYNIYDVAEVIVSYVKSELRREKKYESVGVDAIPLWYGNEPDQKDIDRMREENGKTADWASEIPYSPAHDHRTHTIVRNVINGKLSVKLVPVAEKGTRRGTRSRKRTVIETAAIAAVLPEV